MPNAPLLKVIQYLKSNLFRLLVIFAIILGVIGLSKSIFDKITNLNSQYSSEKRRPISSPNDVVKTESKKEEDVRSNNRIPSSKVKSVEGVSTNNSIPDDLSIFSQFEGWLKKWESLHRDPQQRRFPDPRKTRHLLKIGEKLALKRSKLLSEIIQHNPHEALERALPRELVNAAIIPPQIRKNLEKWESGLANLDVFYGCKGGDHLNCEFSRYTNFSDGRTLKTFAYGRRKNLHSQKDLAVWGVSINGHFAAAEKPFSEMGESIEFAGKPMNFNSPAEKNLFKEQAIQAEGLAQKSRSSVRYPVIAGSNGVTIFLENLFSDEKLN